MGGDDDDEDIDTGKGEGEEEDDDEEFSFVLTNPDGSPISPDDAFRDRPLYPLFDQRLLLADDVNSDSSASMRRPPLRKLFAPEEEDPSEPVGPHCKWSGKKVVDVAPEKSNFTGFFGLWRFPDVKKLRSTNDGKDHFMFLNYHSNTVKETGNNKKMKKGNGGKGKTATYGGPERTARNASRFGRTGSWGFSPMSM